MTAADRESQFRQMRDTAREIFHHALAEASISKAFARHVHCERGVLRICEDLYDLQAYSRVLVVSIGKAGHTMVEALAQQVGDARSKALWPVRSSPRRRCAAFAIFAADIPRPMPNPSTRRMPSCKTLEAQTAASLVIFMLSGGGSSIVEKPIDDEISLDDLIATYRALCFPARPSPKSTRSANIFQR